MPSTMLCKNVSAQTIAAGYLVDTAPGGVQLAGAAQVGQTSLLLAARPLGLVVADIGVGQTGEVYVNGRRAAKLAPNEGVSLGQKLIAAGAGLVKGAPAGYTGWAVGRAAEAKTASAQEQVLQIDLAAKP